MLLAVRGVGRAAATEHEPVLRGLVGYVQLIRGNRTLMILMLLAAATEVFGFHAPERAAGFRPGTSSMWAP